MSVQQHCWAVCPSLYFFLFWNERKQQEGNSHHLAGLTPSCTPEISMGQPSHSDGRRHPHWLRSVVSTGSQSPKAGFYPLHSISDQQSFKRHDAALHPQQEMLVGSKEGASRRKAERGHSSASTWICHAFLASSETDMGMSDVAICSFAIERICVMRAILGASFACFLSQLQDKKQKLRGQHEWLQWHYVRGEPAHSATASLWVQWWQLQITSSFFQTFPRVPREQDHCKEEQCDQIPSSGYSWTQIPEDLDLISLVLRGKKIRPTVAVPVSVFPFLLDKYIPTA